MDYKNQLVGYGGYGVTELFGGIASVALYIPSTKPDEWFDQFADILKPEVNNYRVMEIMHTLFPNYTVKGINFMDWLTHPHWGDKIVPESGGNGISYNMMTDAKDFDLEKFDHIMASVVLMSVDEVNEWVERGVPIETISYQLYEVAIEGVGDELYTLFSKEVEESNSPSNKKLAITIRLASVIAQCAWLADKTRIEMKTHTSLPEGISAYTLNFYDARVREMPDDSKRQVVKMYLLKEHEEGI